MPDYVDNSLTIHCEDEKIMKKIKMMIFDENEDKERIFTMTKMLPLPERFLGIEEYTEYGYYWCNAIWGTKWDVQSLEIIESGSTIKIYYQTAWDPNYNYIELLCLYVQTMLFNKNREDFIPISIKLHYFEYMEDFGDAIEWLLFEHQITKRHKTIEFTEL